MTDEWNFENKKEKKMDAVCSSCLKRYLLGLSDINSKKY